MSRALVLTELLCAGLLACTGGGGVVTPADDSPPGGAAPAATLDALDAAGTEAYLRQLAPMFAGRVLTAEERAQITGARGAAIRPILDAWTREAGFAEAARLLVETDLAVSGTRDGIDWNLPGNLAHKIAKDDLPWSTLVTSETCVDGAGADIACDTGAPYAAGVLTTRAFLASRAGRFNLTRAGTLLGVFACRKYPVEEALEPRIQRERLIEMFRATSAEEQTVEAAKAGFGNGLACYSCHGQFGPHAQLFVRFDRQGVWRGGDEVTGLQNPDPTAQLGESVNGLMRSHLESPEEAKAERSQMFGVPVENLAEAGRVLGSHEIFHACAVENTLEFGLGLGRGAMIDRALVEGIAARVRGASADPTWREIVVETFSDPTVAVTAAAELRAAGETP